MRYRQGNDINERMNSETPAENSTQPSVQSHNQPHWMAQLQAHQERVEEEALQGTKLNQRLIPESRPNLSKENRRASVLVEFPEKNFEAFVIQWKHTRPTVLIQLKRDILEPIQFAGRLIPKEELTPEQQEAQEKTLENPLKNFIDPVQSSAFTETADRADILFSVRMFQQLHPRSSGEIADFAELALPADAMWECRQEAMNALGIADQVGF